jgi:steroid 5-alpha reductase family enzyme
MMGWQLLFGWAVMAIAMTGAWWWQRRYRNAAVVDVVWTLGTGGLAIALLITADGLPARRWLVGAVTAAWSLRLGIHLLPRLWHRAEDRRYQQLRERWGTWADVRFFLFFQSQAIAAPLFAVPMFIAGSSRGPLNFLDVVGLFVGVVGVAGEWLADAQLSRFRSNSDNRGRVCNVGLWRYSRHPNYFFEWLHWWSYVFLATTSSWWWVTLLAPLAMFYFLNYVTGVPPAEAQSLISRGNLYRDYQRSTSRFFPWPPSGSKLAPPPAS